MEAAVVIRLLLTLILLGLSSSAIAQRPVPNVITGGNPYKKDVPWPKSSGESTYYKRAYAKVQYYKYIRHQASCAAHRRSYYCPIVKYR